MTLFILKRTCSLVSFRSFHNSVLDRGGAGGGDGEGAGDRSNVSRELRRIEPERDSLASEDCGAINSELINYGT